MLQSLADSSSSAIEKRLAAVSERLKEIERRKAAVDDRQDDIDRLAFETIATMVDMQGKIETLMRICEVEESEVIVKAEENLLYSKDSEPTEAEKSVTEDEDDSTDLQVKIEDELPESSKSL